MTENKQPTSEQNKEFWFKLGYRLDNVGWYVPFKESAVADYYIGYTTEMPIDLNNLFKYAVPKLFKDGQGGVEFRYYPARLVCVLTTECEAGFDETETYSGEFDPTLALFWAIYEIIKEGDKNGL